MTSIQWRIMIVGLPAVAALFVQQTCDIWDTKRHNSQADRLCSRSGRANHCRQIAL